MEGNSEGQVQASISSRGISFDCSRKQEIKEDPFVLRQNVVCQDMTYDNSVNINENTKKTNM